MNNGKILFIKFPRGWNYPIDSDHVKEFTTTFQVWDPVTSEYEEKMQLYPGHNSPMLAVMPDNQHLVIPGGFCFTKADEANLFKLTAPADVQDFLKKCQSIELIDLKNKTRKQIGVLPSSTKFKLVIGHPVVVDNQRILYVGGRYTDAPTPSSDGLIAIWPYSTLKLVKLDLLEEPKTTAIR